MKIFTKMAAVVLACMLAVPGEARVNVVYQRQDSLRIVGLLQQARAMKKKPASWMLWSASSVICVVSMYFSAISLALSLGIFCLPTVKGNITF